MCQTTPTRRSPLAPVALTVSATSLVHRVELVVAGDLLDEPAAALVLEDDEMPKQLQEPAVLEDALEQDFELGQLVRAPALRPRSSARA